MQRGQVSVDVKEKGKQVMWICEMRYNRQKKGEAGREFRMAMGTKWI